MLFYARIICYYLLVHVYKIPATKILIITLNIQYNFVRLVTWSRFSLFIHFLIAYLRYLNSLVLIICCILPFLPAKGVYIMKSSVRRSRRQSGVSFLKFKKLPLFFAVNSVFFLPVFFCHVHNPHELTVCEVDGVKCESLC